MKHPHNNEGNLMDAASHMFRALDKLVATKGYKAFDEELVLQAIFHLDQSLSYISSARNSLYQLMRNHKSLKKAKKAKRRG